MSLNLEIVCTMRGRLVGLLGRPSFKGVLMLVPCHDIHTLGMRHSIDVAFIAADGTVVESYRGVAPCRHLKNREAVATLERFADSNSWFVPGDRIQSRIHIERVNEGEDSL